MAFFQPPEGISLDVGNLTAFDERTSSENKDSTEVAREATEALVHAIFSLPIEDNEDGRFVKLPEKTYQLPREKPIPRPRAPTKWEKYAQERGIQKKKKRDRLVLDEQTGDYIPRYGRGSKNALDRDIVLPHKESKGDDYNPFQEKRQEKKKRVQDNLKKQRANIGRASKANGIQPMQALDIAKKGPSGRKFLPKNSLKDSLAVVQRSTASVGQFDKKVKNEPKRKLRGVKKKHQAVIAKSAMKSEQQRLGKIADRVLNA